MAPQTARLLLPEDLTDSERTDGFQTTDQDALRAVSRWVEDFVASPHGELGRAGTVCPFVPGSLKRRTLFFAPEHIADLDAPEVVELMLGYKRRLLATTPENPDDAIYHTIIVVFPDLPAERAAGLFNDVLGQIAVPSFEEDGVIFGPFYEGNPGGAIYNESFMPFQSPVPFLFVRHTVLGDWKFFLDDTDALDRWARRFGASGAIALAEELRRHPWRVAPR